MKHFLLTFLFINLALLVSSQVFTDSNLPIVIINTDINPYTGRPNEIPDEPKVLATMKIISGPVGLRNHISDQYNPEYLNYSGRIGIEIRGSSSQSLPKKPYGLTTLQDDNVSNNNVSILGMPKENDWILNSIAFDPSLIRNYLSYDLARRSGKYAARGKFCEVVINGDYKGLYIFMEKIKVDNDRVNIVKMLNTDNQIPNVTGGYIVKADKTTGGDPIAWTMPSYTGSTNYLNDTPNPDEITSWQKNYIQNIFTNLQYAATTQNNSASSGFPSYIDIPSFIDFMLINEIASNADVYQYSTYFHKDRNGKLRAGPVWDFDLTYGNDLFHWGFDRSHTDVWQFNDAGNTGSKFWRDLYNNPTFNCYLAKRWRELTSEYGPLNYSAIVDHIDELTSIISEAEVRENQRWGTIPNHNLEIANMKLWIQTRMNWMNSKLSNTSACSNPNIPALVITKINYNPAPVEGYTDHDLEFIEITNTGEQTVYLTGIYFSELGISFQFPAGSSVDAGNSLFLAGDELAFQQYYGIEPFGKFTRDLSNKSEFLVLSDAWGNVIDSVRYSDENPWPEEADGNGFFLQLANVNIDNSLASNWTIGSSLTTVIENNRISEEISVYPNPASSIINITGKKVMFNSFELFDISGRKIIEGNEIGSNHFSVNLAEFLPALYILKIECNNGENFIKKISKVN